MNNQLVTKVNNIEGKIPTKTGLANKSQYDTDEKSLEQKDGKC